MKLNLIRTPSDYLNGYTNVSVFIDQTHPDVVLSNYENLQGVEDNEATEIRAIDIIDYYPLERQDQLFDHWISKLRHGGVITVGGVDLVEMAQLLYHYNVTTEDFNSIFFGASKETWQRRQSVQPMHRLANLLSQKGLEVIEKFITGQRFVVKVRRP